MVVVVETTTTGLQCLQNDCRLRTTRLPTAVGDADYGDYDYGVFAGGTHRQTIGYGRSLPGAGLTSPIVL